LLFVQHPSLMVFMTFREIFRAKSHEISLTQKVTWQHIDLSWPAPCFMWIFM